MSGEERGRAGDRWDWRKRGVPQAGIRSDNGELSFELDTTEDAALFRISPGFLPANQTEKEATAAANKRELGEVSQSAAPQTQVCLLSHRVYSECSAISENVPAHTPKSIPMS